MESVVVMSSYFWYFFIKLTFLKHLKDLVDI